LHTDIGRLPDRARSDFRPTIIFDPKDKTTANRIRFDKPD
jgi:hypothetical protein